MAIWQAMKGDSQNPKRFWNRRDLKHQHFSVFRGRKWENQVKKGDLMTPGPGSSGAAGRKTAREESAIF